MLLFVRRCPANVVMQGKLSADGSLLPIEVSRVTQAFDKVVTDELMFKGKGAGFVESFCPDFGAQRQNTLTGLIVLLGMLASAQYAQNQPLGGLTDSLSTLLQKLRIDAV